MRNLAAINFSDPCLPTHPIIFNSFLAHNYVVIFYFSPIPFHINHTYIPAPCRKNILITKPFTTSPLWRCQQIHADFSAPYLIKTADQPWEQASDRPLHGSFSARITYSKGKEIHILVKN